MLEESMALMGVMLLMKGMFSPLLKGKKACY